MPYVKGEVRERLDKWLDDRPITTDAGSITYIFYKIAMQEIQLNWGANYAAHALMYGVLETCKQELYRRLTAPYENKKLVENGDVTL